MSFSHRMFLTAIFFCFLLFQDSMSSQSLKLTANPSSTVVVGSRVILHCLVGTQEPRKLKTNWMHGGKMVGENCDSFSNKKSRKAICPPGDEKTASYYDYIIDPVSWEDRGKWSCYYGMNFSEVFLNVIVPPVFEKHTFEKKGEIVGDGSRTKPFDLTSGQTVSMTCKTRCGYPKSEVLWTFENATSNGRIGEPTTDSSAAECNITTKAGMYVSSSSLSSINCSRHKFVGLNKISCTLSTREPFKYDEGASRSRDMFILCPGGSKAPVLTYGEMIAIAVGAAIALILIFLNCFLFKESRRKAIMRNRALSV